MCAFARAWPPKLAVQLWNKSYRVQSQEALYIPFIVNFSSPGKFTTIKRFSQAGNTSQSLAIRLRSNRKMSEASANNGGQKAMLASQRAKQEAEARGEKPKSRFANLFPLTYKETFSQWVCHFKVENAFNV
jgi:hypothetical protein